MLHEHGLSIPYKRVLDISAQLGDAVVSRYNEEGVVCPPELRTGVFCTSAMDNIDHNPTSAKFVVHKTEREFSGIAIDQAHEQSNAAVKGDGGAIGITEDPSAFRRWMVSGPEISRLVKQYENTTKEKVEKLDTRHHEATRQEQDTFISTYKS